MKKIALFGSVFWGLIYFSTGATSAADNRFQPTSDRLMAILLLGADYRIEKSENEFHWTAVKQSPLTFHRKSGDTTVVVEDKGRCLTTLTFTSNRQGTTTTRVVEVSPDQASSFELYDGGFGYWHLRGKGSAFWCEKVNKNGISSTNCDGLMRDAQGRFLVPLNGGASSKAIVDAADFSFPRGCFAQSR